MNVPSIAELPPLVWSGLVSGALGGVLGASIVMLYRASGTLNLAVGALYVAGGLVAAEWAGRTVPGDVVLVVLSGFLGALCGVVGEIALQTPLRNAPGALRLLGTVAFGSLVIGVVVVVWGAQPIIASPIASGNVKVSSQFLISNASIILVGCALVLGLGAEAWLRYSKSGHVLSGVTEDARAAELLGIRVERFRFVTVAVTTGLVAMFGAISVSQFLTEPTDGLTLSLNGFVAAYLLGGNLSPLLAVGGGVVAGLIDVFVARIFSSALSGVAIGGLLIVVLLARKKRMLAAAFS